MKKEVSLAIGQFVPLIGEIAAIDLAKEIGLSCVDFDLIRYNCNSQNTVYASKNEDEVFSYFEKIKKHADDIGVRIVQTHGRIMAYNYDEEHNKNELCGFALDCVATKALGAKYCVVHAVHLGLDATADEQKRYNSRMFSDYMPYARKNGIIVATETLGDMVTPEGREGVDFFGDLREFRHHYDEVTANSENSPHFCTCIDTGHTNKVSRFQGKEKVPEFIRQMKGTIGCLHLNDNNTLTDEHKVPGMGTLNWKEVLCALDDAGFDGVYNMELNLEHFGRKLSLMKEYARFSVSVMKEMLEDHYQ